MGVIVLPEGRDRQPDYLVESKYPLGILIDGPSMMSIGRRSGGPSSNSMLPGVAEQGAGMYAAPAGGRAVYTASLPAIGAGDFTIVVYYTNPAALTANSALLGSSLSSFVLWARHSGVGSNVGLLMPGTVYVNSGISASAAGTHCVVAQRQSGQVLFNVDGLTSAVANSTSLAAINSLALNSSSSSGSYYNLVGTYYYALFLPYAIGEEEAAKIHENPWSIIAP